MTSNDDQRFEGDDLQPDGSRQRSHGEDQRHEHDEQHLDIGLRIDIEDDERWLDGMVDDAEVLHRHQTNHFQAHKQHIAIAIHERWLDGAMAQYASSQSHHGLDRIKQRVRVQLDEASRARQRGVFYSSVRRWAVAGTSLAACLALVMLGWRGLHTTTTPGVTVVKHDADVARHHDDPKHDSFCLLIAALYGGPSDEDVSLSLLDHDIRTLEWSLSESDIVVESDGDMVEDLFDDSDRLLAEMEADMG